MALHNIRTSLCILWLLSFVFCDGPVVFLEPARDAVAAPGKAFLWDCTTNYMEDGASSEYRWRFHDADVSMLHGYTVYDNGTLLIHQMTEDKEGDYQCVNEMSGEVYYSSIFTLRTAYLSGTFKESPHNMNVTVDSTLNISCNIDSRPPAEITWLYNGNIPNSGVTHPRHDGSSQFVIQSVSYDDDGEYRCQAWNSVSNEVRFSGIATVKVRGRPQIVTSPRVVAAIGSTVYIPCYVISEPIVNISWSKPSGVLPPGRHHVCSNGTLKIYNLTMTDPGIYMCTAVNSWGSTTVSSVLTSEVSNRLPSFIRQPSKDVTLVRGTNTTTTLTCMAAGFPPPDITWTDPERELADPKMVPYNGGLTISSETTQPGQWTCHARNDVGVIQYTFNVHINEKPTILTIPPSIITIREHERLQLPCECTGSPELRITWQLPRYHYITEGLWNVTMSSQQRSHQVIPNGTLILYIPSVDNNGIYTCVCENSAGVDTIQYNVYIWASPYVHRISGNTVITEGDSATLTCNYNAYPEPHVRWYRGNDSSYITNSSNYQVYDNFLQLINMRINMQTLYRCVVTNQWGTGNISTIVTMKPLPKVRVDSPLVMVELNQSVMLNCETDSAVISWYKGGRGERIIEDENVRVLHNNSLHIEVMRKEYYDEYTCEAESSVGVSVATILLMNSDEYQWLAKPEDKIVIGGRNATFTCQMRGCDDERNDGNLIMQSWLWYFHNSTMAQQIIIANATTSILTVRNASRESIGIYECKKNCSGKVLSAQARLDVIYKPINMYTESAHWMSVAEDEGVELYYKYIYPHQEAYNVSIKDPYGVSVSPLATRGNNSIFTYNITNASVLTHEGLWEMSMCNTAGCASAFTFVFVRGVPVIYEAKVTKSRNGKLTTIVCQAKGSPLPHVTYYQGMTLITTTPNVIPGHFVVGTMSPQNPLKLAIEYPYMHNDYRCVGRNDFGSSALEFKAPETPQVSIVNLTHSSFRIQWLISTKSTLPVIYTIQHKLPTGGTRSHGLPAESKLYDVTGLGAYTEHWINVTARNNLTQSKVIQFKILTNATAPSEPVNLQITSYPGYRELTWTRPLMLNGNPADVMYELAMMRLEDSVRLTHTLPVTQTSVLFFIDKLSEYVLHLSAYNPTVHDSMKYSESVTAYINATQTDEQPLKISPANVTAVLTEMGDIQISWSVLFGVSRYHVEYEVGSDTMNVPVDGSDTYIITKPEASSEYSIRVAGVTDAGVGVHSDDIHIMTLTREERRRRIHQIKPSPLNLEDMLSIVFGVLVFAVMITMLVVAIIFRRTRYSGIMGALKRQRASDRAQIVFTTRSRESESSSPVGPRDLPEENSYDSTRNSASSSRNSTGCEDDGSVQMSELDMTLSGDVKVILSGEERAVDVGDNSRSSHQYSSGIISVVAKLKSETQTMADCSPVRGRRLYKKLREAAPTSMDNSNSTIMSEKDNDITGDLTDQVSEGTDSEEATLNPPVSNNTHVGSVSRRRPITHADSESDTSLSGR